MALCLKRQDFEVKLMIDYFWLLVTPVLIMILAVIIEIIIEKTAFRKSFNFKKHFFSKDIHWSPWSPICANLKDLFPFVSAMVKILKRNKENALHFSWGKKDIVHIIDLQSVPVQITMDIFQTARTNNHQHLNPFLVRFTLGWSRFQFEIP